MIVINGEKKRNLQEQVCKNKCDIEKIKPAEKGDQGPKGEDGNIWYESNGVPDNSVGNQNDWCVDVSTGSIYRKSAVQWNYKFTIEGKEGQMGPKGPKGDKGDTGPQGPRGYTGAQGIQGPRGPQGPQGEQGKDGTPGKDGTVSWEELTPEQKAELKGEKGDTGETGPRGPQGEQGIQGPEGPKGATGDTGARGPKGDKGDTGEPGSEGPRGATGPQGEQGEKGDTGESGVYIGSTEPTDPEIKVWIDSTGEASGVVSSVNGKTGVVVLTATDIGVPENVATKEDIANAIGNAIGGTY